MLLLTLAGSIIVLACLIALVRSQLRKRQDQNHYHLV